MPNRSGAALRPTIASSRFRRYRLTSTLDSTAARAALCAILGVCLVAFVLLTTQQQASAPLDLRQLLPDSSQHFLPTPIAALTPVPKTGPPAVSSQEGGLAGIDVGDRVEVVNTAGLGALLRAEPPDGRLVASLSDGQVLEVLERRTVNDAEWLRVRTGTAVEGWVFALLVAPVPATPSGG